MAELAKSRTESGIDWPRVGREFDTLRVYRARDQPPWTKLAVVASILVTLLTVVGLISPAIGGASASPVPREPGSATAATQRAQSSVASSGEKSKLSYRFTPTNPVGDIGVNDFIPGPGETINDTLTYDPLNNSVWGSVADPAVNTRCSCGTSPSNVSYGFTSTFPVPKPGTYLMGVGSGIGGTTSCMSADCSGNWAAKDVYLFGSSGETTIVSSSPNPISHATLYVKGSVTSRFNETPVFNATTGALMLIPQVPTPTTTPGIGPAWGLAVFPYNYTGGNLTMTVLFNATTFIGTPEDGLVLFFFMNDTLVNPVSSKHLESETASGSFLPVVVENLHINSTDNFRDITSGDIGFPNSTTQYFAIQWDPLWTIESHETPGWNVFAADPIGNFISQFAASPSAIVLGNQTTFVVSFSQALKKVTIRYTDLPPGCVSANTSKLTCTPTAAGTFTTWVKVQGRDKTWDIASTTLTVYPS